MARQKNRGYQKSQRNGGSVRKSAASVFRAMYGGAHETASNSGVATLRNFCWAAGPQKCLLGSLPKPGSLGQNVPKRLAASPPLSRLFLIGAPVRKAEQMVDVGLDRHGLPHIPLGLPILGIEGLFLIRQLPPLFFQRVHFGELFTA